MTMTDDELSELFDVARGELDRLIDGHHAMPATIASPRRRMGRRRSLIAVAALLAVGVAGMAVMSPRHGQAPQPGAGASSDEQPNGTGAAVVSPRDVIVWERGTDLDSLARSWVEGVVAGPGGFVATGSGLENGRNPGRVWFSADGLVWEEPAPEIFWPLAVSPPAAGSDGFYVLASPNPDWLGMPEGAPGRGHLPTQLYRSTDGRTWEEWGDQWAGSLVSANGVLLREESVGDASMPIEWSVDGLQWHPVTFSDERAADMEFGLVSPGVTAGPDTSYIVGWSTDVLDATYWRSADGESWQAIADPPTIGSTAALPDGLLLADNFAAEECVRRRTAADRMGQGSFDVDPSGCEAQPELHRFVHSAQVWMPAPGPPTRSLWYPALAVVGRTAIAVVLAPDGGFEIWAAPSDTLSWQHVGPQLIYTCDHYSRGPQVASSGDRVLIITDWRAIGGETAVVVGVLAQ